ncbi:MAG: hypothetical protein V7K54_27160 [Nostoc sp.]
MHLWELETRLIASVQELGVRDAINRVCTGIGSRDAINRVSTGHLICHCCERRYINQVQKEQLSQLRCLDGLRLRNILRFQSSS